MNMDNLKDINIGKIIEIRWKELNIPIERTIKFFKYSEEEIFDMFKKEHLDTQDLLKWSKLLEYDFFRIYSQHLILYSPPMATNFTKRENKKSDQLPTFRKNLYTKDIIDFVIEQLDSGDKTKQQIIDYYKIPKTTFYKWIKKYKNEK